MHVVEPSRVAHPSVDEVRGWQANGLPVARLEDQQIVTVVPDDGDVVPWCHATDEDGHRVTLVDGSHHIAQGCADLALVGVVDELVAVAGAASAAVR